MPMNNRLLRPRQSGFNPRSISGLALWLDAADSQTLYQDAAATIPATAANDPVGAWLDKSGNNRHATQATGSRRPLITTSGINGKRSLTADNVDDVMSLGNISSAFPSAGSGFFVFKTGGTDNIYTVFKTRTNNSVTFENSGGNFRTYNGAWRTTRLNAIPVRLPNAASDAAVVHTLQSSGSAYEMRTNGALLVSAAADFSAGGTYELMGDSDGSVYSLGVFAEAILYSRFLTPSERVRVEAYLASKWGITLAPQVSNADAQDWVNRVYANGGTVSATTASAVNTFCDAIDTAGIRDRFYRLNLFCGNSDASLNAVRTPLYRGQSLSGTQYGNTTDTNVNFVQGDYAETSGLTTTVGGGKYLNTGLTPDAMALADVQAMHLAVAHGPTASADLDPRPIGANSAVDRFQMILTTRVSFTGLLGVSLGRFNALNSSNLPTGVQPSASWVVSRTSATALVIYKNGSADTTLATSVTGILSHANAFTVGRVNNAGTIIGDSAALAHRHYSIGAAMTAAQVAAYEAALAAFRTALGRTA